MFTFIVQRLKTQREQCWDSLVCHDWVFFGRSQPSCSAWSSVNVRSSFSSIICSCSCKVKFVSLSTTWVPDPVKGVGVGWGKIKGYFLFKCFQVFLDQLSWTVDQCWPALAIFGGGTFRECHPFPNAVARGRSLIGIRLFCPCLKESFHLDLAFAHWVHSDMQTYLPCMQAVHTIHHLQAALRHRTSSLPSKIFLIPPSIRIRRPELSPGTTTGPPYGAIRPYAPLPSPHTKLQKVGFSWV